MRNIKLFNTHSEYQAAESSLILPNVSFCKDTPNTVHYNPYVEPDPYNGHEYVDLGLSVKWAKMNIGANSITDTGLYFQWGDTSGYTAAQVGSGEGQKYFDWRDYKYSDGGMEMSNMTKYNKTDHLKTLEVSDDAAVANMGGSWRMPTEAEFNELLTASTITKNWTSINGVNGYKFSLIADPTKYVFFPAAGYCRGGSVNDVGSYGYYWSSSLSNGNLTYGYCLFFYSGKRTTDLYIRRDGHAIRGVVE